MDLKVVYLLAIVLLMHSNVMSQCGLDYFLDNHTQFNQLDICTVESEIAEEGWTILNNWGLRVEWYDASKIVFINNLVGQVFLLDIETHELENLTDHFEHSGFSRVYKLQNKDLLLVGSLSGGLCGNPNPLVICEDRRFEGNLYVLQYPYDDIPVPLNEPAWEGVALSTINDQIVWSDTRGPFEQENILLTALSYLFTPSNLWTGYIAYDDFNQPFIENKRKIIDKSRIGPAFLEPQNFKGDNNQELIFSTYGLVEGKADLYTYDFEDNKIRRINVGPGYNEWEGIHPSDEYALYENDPTTTLFTDFNPEMYLYNFETGERSRYFFWRDRDDLNGFYIGNTVFSPDGTKLLGVAGAKVGNAGIGYGVGLVIKDISEDLTVTSTASIKDENDFQIYPNPANDIVKINFNPSVHSNWLVTLYQSSGTVLKSFWTNDTNISIDVKDLSKGLYFLTITNENDGISISKKLIIN